MPEVKFKFVGDDSELRKKLENLAKMEADISNNFKSTLSKGGTNALSEAIKQVGKDAAAAAKEAEILNRTASNNAIRDAKLAEMEAMRKARIAIQDEILEQKKLRSAVEQGKITQQEYRSELAKIAVEEKKRSIALRETKKQLSETSEYGKLNKALGDLRKRSKDVLAEMFRMERQGHANTIGYEALRKKSESLVSQTLILDKGIKKIDSTLGLHQRNVGNYGEALELISPELANINQKLQLFGTSLDDLSTKKGAIKDLGASFVKMGKGILSFVLSPVGLLITALGALFMLFKSNKQTVIDFNNGLLNVGKTTGLEGKALQALSDDIIGLSRALKTVTADKLLEYATVAGQLGVKGSQNILAFTEALAKLETASDISGEEGASQIARLLQLVDGGVQNIKAFGDEIVNLGNNFPATESEILANATRIAQSTGIYKLGRQEILAYATATKSVGVEAELVGSTVGRTLGTLEKAIRSGKGVATILKLVGGTQAELSKRFREDASGVLLDFIGGLNRTSKTAADFNRSLEAVGITAQRDRDVIGSLASKGYSVLAEAMTKVKDATGAMDNEFETASGKIVNQSARIGIAWDNLVLSIENGSGAIGVASVAVVGFFAEILEGITNVVTSDSWGEFFTRINPTNWGKGGAINDAMDLNKTFQEISDFNKKINKMGDGSNAWIRTEFSNLTKQEFEKAYKAAKENSDKMAKASLEYEAGVKSTRFQETEDTVNDYKKQESIARLHLSRMEQIRSKKGYDFSGKPKVGIAGLEEESEKERLKRERAEAAAAKKAERLSENYRKTLERQRSLQLDIDKINEAASRNQLSRDQSEVESIKDKYAKIREEVRKFYDDPKNKGQKVDASGLIASENFEVSEANTRFATKRLEESFDAQKRLLDEYNSFAEQTSKEEADKRFGNELSAFKDYEKNVENAYWDLLTKKKTADRSGLNSTIKLTQAEEEQFKILEKRREEIALSKRQKESKDLVDALNSARTLDDKLLKIEREYQEKLKALRDNNELTPEREKILNKEKTDKTSQVTVDELTGSDSWISLFNSLDEMTATQIDIIIKEIEAKFDTLKVQFNPIDLDAIRKKLTEAKNILIQDNPFAQVGQSLKAIFTDAGDGSEKSAKDIKKNWTDLGKSTEASFNFIADAINSTDILKDAIGEVGNTALMSMMAIASTAIAVSTAIKTAEKASVILAIISAALVVVQAIAGLFKSIFAAGDKRLEKSIQSKKEAVEELDRAFERLGRSINKSVGNSYYTDSQKQIDNLKQQSKIVEQMIADEDAKKKTDKGKLQDYRNQLEDIQYKIEDIQQGIIDTLVQTTFKDFASELGDALVSAFEQGEDAVDSLNKTFDQFIKDAVINGLKMSILQKPIDEMIKSVSDYMKGNDFSLNGFDFTQWREKLGEAGEDFTSALEEAYKGLGLEKDSSSSGGGLSGSIKRELTEATASELTGLYRSTYDLAKRSFQESQTQGLTLSKQLDIANSSLTALNAIQNNTANTVVELKSAVSELQKVNKNLGGKYQ